MISDGVQTRKLGLSGWHETPECLHGIGAMLTVMPVLGTASRRRGKGRTSRQVGSTSCGRAEGG